MTAHFVRRVDARDPATAIEAVKAQVPDGRRVRTVASARMVRPEIPGVPRSYIVDLALDGEDPATDHQPTEVKGY